jgi:hypothetical protein
MTPPPKTVTAIKHKLIFRLPDLHDTFEDSLRASSQTQDNTFGDTSHPLLHQPTQLSPNFHQNAFQQRRVIKRGGVEKTPRKQPHVGKRPREANQKAAPKERHRRTEGWEASQGGPRDC